MDINILKKRFLSEHVEYANDIGNFINYFETQVDGVSICNDIVLNGMRTEDIIKSLAYYVEIGQISKKEPARKYTSAVAQWFEFLFENSAIENTDLKNALGAPSSRKSSYLYQCRSYINDCEQLKEKEPYSPLDGDQVRKLLDWSKKAIDDGIKAPDKDIAFKRMAAALCIKLMLFTGVTYRVARTLEFKDYNEIEATLTINGYKIMLPLGLTYELRAYKHICEARKFDLENGYLFVTADGEQWGDKTTSSGIPTFLDSQLNITSVNSVVKYGIKQLLDQSVSDSIILKLTGARKELLDDCIDPKQENEDMMFSYINSKLIHEPIFVNL